MNVILLTLMSAWEQLDLFFMRGDPPLIFRLLLINTIFLVAFVLRKAITGYRLRHPTAEIVQGLLIASNLLIMTNDRLPPVVMHFLRLVF